MFINTLDSNSHREDEVVNSQEMNEAVGHHVNRNELCLQRTLGQISLYVKSNNHKNNMKISRVLTGM